MSGRFKKYLLSGFVKCGVCGANYTITTKYSYRCGTFRNRGPVGCSNHLAISRRRLERAVLGALRDHLYTEESLEALIARVREGLEARAEDHASQRQQNSHDTAMRQVDREIENIKHAVRLGKATGTLLEMLEQAEQRRKEMLASVEPADDVPTRLAKVLQELPELVRQYLDDLNTLLAAEQVDRGKDILAALGTTVRLHPHGDHLEAEIAGKVGKLLLLAASKTHSGFNSTAFRWLGEEDSNPR